MQARSLSAAAVAAIALVGCATTQAPATNVHQPMSVRPAPPPAPVAANGAIYQAGTARPLFEDRRARYLGDTLTIQITEKTQANKKSATTAERTASVKAGIPVLNHLPGKGLLGLGLEANDSNKFSGKGESNANNDFSGTITVTVIDVYPNGNLLVSGEKQVAINQAQEFVRFSGVVNPNNITSANTVQSTQVADARIEYKGSGFLDSAQQMGWLSRFFLTVLPF